MFSTNTFVALLAFVAPLLVRADVDPTTPAPGAVYNEGSNCPVAWLGDSSSTTLWKDMAIELMAGSNFDMEFITTVATGQDGTVSGQFSYPCPNVVPNSAIYFYQFVAPAAPNVTWTGRFVIASASGATTPAANNVQPDGAAIPWGNGSLADPSSAVPPPSFVSSITMPSSMPNISSSVIAIPSITASSAPSTLAAVVTSATAVAPSSSAVPTSQSTSTSGAMTGFDIRILGTIAAAAATLALPFVW